MIHNNLVKRNGLLVGSQVSSLLAGDINKVSMKGRYYAHLYSNNGLQRNILSLRHLHISHHHYSTSNNKINALTLKPRYLFSTPSPNYNQFPTIRQLSTLSPPNNKFQPTTHQHKFISSHYSTITLQIQKKLQKIQGILHSPQKDMYKIVQEIIIVLEAFANVNRREILQENVVKVVKEFGKKLVSAYLQTVQAQQLQHLQIKNSHRNHQPQQTDSTYSLHDNYTTPPLEPGQKQFVPINASASVDLNFILFYIETVKTWLLMKLENDAVVRQAQAQLFDIFAVREVSALNDTLKGAVQNLVLNYIEEQSAKKREMFPFELKVRGLCLLPFFENKKHIEKYIQRLADQNLGIYLKQSQILTLMYDITQLQPALNDCTQFIYQIQSTRIYQNLAQINCSYLKALFIQYTRKFMVSYQQIQFYELFRDVQSRIRYPTIRTFIRLTKILNVQAADLHCQYNKTMNKYNYNIIISIVISQNYNIDNTKFDQLFQLFEQLNAYEQCGEVMYDELAKFLRAYVVKQESGLKKEELQRIYKLFQHVLREARPIFKYEDRQALNREYSRKSAQLLAVLFDILIDKYPQIIVQGSKFIRNYLLSQQGNTFSISFLPYDDREIRVEAAGRMLKQKIEKVKEAYAKVLEKAKDMSTKKLGEFLDSMNLFAQMNVQWIKANNNNTQVNQQKPTSSTTTQQPTKLLPTIYPTLPSYSFQLSLIKQTIQPILKQYLDLANKDMIKKLSNQQFRQLYRNLYLSLIAVNTLQCKKQTVQVMDGYIEQLGRKVLYEMKFAMDGVEKEAELKRTTGIERLQISTPKGNVELLLTLHQLIKLTQKLNSFHNLTKTQHHLSSTSTPLPSSLQTLTVSLPLIYNFINKIAIKNLKGIQQHDLINMLMFLKTLQEIKSDQKQNILLLEINTLVWEYLYQSMSMFLMYMSEKGKIYLKLTNTSAEQFINVINHFVANKAIFRSLPSKKRLVPLQTILVGLVRRKYIKLTASHLKRSQSAKTFLAFLQIFEYPQNLTVDMKKFIQQTQFTTTQLQQVPSDILQRFSDINWTIARYLQDSNQALTTAKKLGKLSAQELRKQFDQGKSGKIYQMILKSSKYSLPFMLPQPKKDDVNAKGLYILERIYHKISRKNNYGVTKQKISSQKQQTTTTKSSKRNGSSSKSFQPQQPLLAQPDTLITQPITQPLTYQPPTTPCPFHQINLQQQKAYIKSQSLVNYTYENHYKLSSNKLPIHFKKQSWKNIYAVPKELQIESLEIDQKIDQTIYKQVLLATLGYVEKVKLIAKQFHAHSFIQYTAAQLDMQVFYHGCIARISRKNKPQQNILLVCAVQTNYKLLYICTHILRQSGQNAYIVMDKTKQTDFKDFLEKLLPQPFEAEESQIVDKVVKGEIALD